MAPSRRRLGSSVHGTLRSRSLRCSIALTALLLAAGWFFLQFQAGGVPEATHRFDGRDSASLPGRLRAGTPPHRITRISEDKDRKPSAKHKPGLTVRRIPAVVKLVKDDLLGNILRAVAVPVAEDEMGPLFFIHIGKAGGTSFDKMMKNVCTQQVANDVHYVRWCPTLRRKYVGMLHYDTGLVEMAEEVARERGLPRPECLVLLRDPVDRCISHFNFAKTLEWTEGKTIRSQTLDEYLDDPVSMLETNMIVLDGWSGVRWVTSTSVSYSVRPRRSREEIIAIEERLQRDPTAVMRFAAERLRQAFWVGTHKDLEGSIRRLWSRLGAPAQSLPHKNRARTQKASGQLPSDAAKAKIRDLFPMDTWLYTYANRLIDQGATAALPPFPELRCRSSRAMIRCDASSALGAVDVSRQDW